MDLKELEISKDVQTIKEKENLTIEEALKRISKEYSEGLKNNGRSKVDKAIY